jgi:hypothetical protein
MALGALRRRVALSALALLVVLLAFVVAPAAHAEIFKCVAPGGAPLYQNFPCGTDAPDTVADAARAPKPAASAGQSAAIPATVAAAAAPASQLRVGMSGDEVRAMLGEPKDVIEDEPASGRVSIWRYADGRTIRFDHKHRVSAVTR